MIIRNSNVFDFNYIPSIIFGREKEMEGIKHAINSFIRGVKRHVFCYGTQGTGKTLISKYLSSHLNNSFYLDAKEYSTKITFLPELARMYGIIIAGRGISFDEFMLRIKGREERIIIFLDEADYFKDKEVLYSLAKSSLNIMFIFISNLPSIFNFMERLSSITTTIEFKRYSPKELKLIIKERARLGLSPSSYDDKIISKIVGFSAKHKANARAGIQLLYNSALFAEEDGRDYISIRDVDKAKDYLLKDLTSYDFSFLEEDKKRILQLLLDSQYKTVEEIAKNFGKSERTIRNYLKDLVKSGYVEEEEVRIGSVAKKIYRIKLRV